jgi:hypothetical protein
VPLTASAPSVVGNGKPCQNTEGAEERKIGSSWKKGGRQHGRTKMEENNTESSRNIGAGISSDVDLDLVCPELFGPSLIQKPNNL